MNIQNEIETIRGNITAMESVLRTLRAAMYDIDTQIEMANAHIEDLQYEADKALAVWRVWDVSDGEWVEAARDMTFDSAATLGCMFGTTVEYCRWDGEYNSARFVIDRQPVMLVSQSLRFALTA